jgi:DNA primase
MTRYTDDSKERVRDAVEMIDLVGTRTELRRAGVNRYEGLCPFHDERTPSFGIDPTRKVFYCFGCGEGGDAFKFVQLTEGLDFKGALEYLADRYGIALEPVEEDPAAAQRRLGRERLLELLERTATFFVRYLWDSDEAAPARTYLAERGLDEAVLREFRVGYAPSAHDTLLRAVRRGGFSNRELWDAGLATRSGGDGMLYARFRRRIMFPLCDLRGRVLGFGARALGAGQKPKYLNSPDGAIYHKGRHLFGADIARAAATKAGSVIVAEGYTDVIAMHQAGLRNTVGLMGTAMTDEQVGELARLAPRVQLALDADAAGQEAMLRAAEAARLAAKRQLDLRVVPLPAGADPADLVQSEGARAVQRLVDRAVPFVRFRVEREIARNTADSDQLVEALRPIFADIPPSALRAELLDKAAAAIGVTPALTAELLSTGARPRPNAIGGPDVSQRVTVQRTTASLDRGTRVERDFLMQCLAVPAQGAEALAAVDIDRTFRDELNRRCARHLLEHLNAPTDGLPAGDHELEALIAQLVVRASREKGSAAALEAETLNLELVGLEGAMAAARGSGEIAPLSARRIDLQRRRDQAIERAIAETSRAD